MDRADTHQTGLSIRCFSISPFVNGSMVLSIFTASSGSGEHVGNSAIARFDKTMHGFRKKRPPLASIPYGPKPEDGRLESRFPVLNRPH